MDRDLTPDDARAALIGATSSAQRLRHRARWAGTKLLIFGTGMGLVTLAVGLVESKLLGAAVFLAWGVLAVLMSRWARRRTAHLPGTSTRIAPYWALGFAFYAVAIAAGGDEYGNPGYWVPAAVVVALPMLVGSIRERRA
ncbi:hypothetical protein [Arthrobacter sp. NPDC092385]|uniref:hypothetical protein n=1 Tax=Arthrobacter sp. NPDC092385 TaxID=3363943 RepID=UPI00381D32A5